MRIFLNDLALGIKMWFRSWNFIMRHGLVHYFIFPVLISVVLGMGLLGLIDLGVDSAMKYIDPWLPQGSISGSTGWEKFLAFMQDISGMALRFVFWLGGIFLSWKLSKYLVLICMSPVMALLSERVEQKLNGRSYAFDMRQFVRDVFRGIVLALRNMFVEVALVLILMALDLMLVLVAPPVTLIATPLISIGIFLIGSYFYGFSVMDYTLERRKMSIRQSVQFIRTQKGVACGIGSIFSLLMLFPVFGTTIATVTCTVAGTLATHEKENAGKKA